MRRLVVLRPEPGASATAERARERGLDPVVISLFRIEPVAWTAPETSGFEGLLLTSANAVVHGGEDLASLRGLPVYAVGDATALAAREAGFDIASTGEAGVERLLGSIDPDLRLLHLCGEDRREPDGARQQISALVVYRSEPVDAPDLFLAGGGVVLVHSPRAAKRLSELVPARQSITVVAISQAAADALGNGWERVEVADAPNDEALLALAARLCNTSPPE
jgi:uroporphyrinogen-III synthase